jgi:nucleoside-diphosphate-sugar epimerase
MATEKILVTGAGGFIGHHLVKRLKDDGHWVRGADIKRPEFEETAADEFLKIDLRGLDACKKATAGVDRVYNLAADMGGIGYITAYLASIARNNTLINANMLEASRQNGVGRFLYTSSACVYARYRQESPDLKALSEADAYPADPEPGYGWEKLYAEELCKYYTNDFGLETRIVRLHNVFGPLGTYQGGKEKAPAAIARKVSLANDGDAIEIWGDGKQTRSFMYIDDCVEGLLRIMDSSITQPINLGTEEIVTVDALVDLVAGIAGKTLVKQYDTSQPQGVRGRNSDNALIRELLGWEPRTPLQAGLIPTYRWIDWRLATTEQPAAAASLRAAG